MCCFQKVTSKGVEWKGKTMGEKTCHTSTDCRMVPLELQRLGLSERELISVRDRQRQDLSGGTSLCGQVMLALGKGDNKSSRDMAFLSWASSYSYRSQAPETHPWNCLHSCPRFVAINCKIMSMSLFSRTVTRKLGLTVYVWVDFLKLILEHYLKNCISTKWLITSEMFIMPFSSTSDCNYYYY